MGNLYGDGIPNGAGIINTTNANGDSCDHYNNIFLEPYLVNPFLPNFNLQEISPCIDAGDPALPLDPDETICDMGALYFDQGSSVFPRNNSTAVDEYKLYPAYPNPFNPTTAISFKLQAASFVNLTIYDIAGREVIKLADGYKSAGIHSVTFDGSNLPSGVYFARLEAGNYVGTQKLLLIK